MPSRAAAVAGLLATLALAGCTGGGPGKDAPSDPFASLTEGAKPRDGMGAISGVVVDAAIRPLQGANVTLVGTGETVATGEGGGFRFEAVEPGVHFLQVGARRHEETQVSVEVAAGQVAPVRVLLVPLEGAEPYRMTMQFRGHIDLYVGFAQFAAEVVAPGTLQCTCSWVFETDPGLQTIVYEAVGASSVANPGTPVTDDGDAYWELISQGGQGDIASEYDDFPFSFHFGNATFPEHGSLFLARITGGALPSGTMDYDLFVTLWYHEEAPAGWTLFDQA